MAPQIMWSIVKAVDEIVNRATSSRMNNIFINKSVCSSTHVRAYLEQFGLSSNDPEALKNSTVRFACVGGAQITMAT